MQFFYDTNVKRLEQKISLNLDKFLTTKVDSENLFIERGCNVNVKDSEGITVLMHSVTNSYSLNYIKILLEADSHTELQDHEGMTALMYACLYSVDKELIDLILDYTYDNDIFLPI